MTPKEKAQELIDKFREYSHTDFDYTSGMDQEIKNAKQCALIAVDEILEATKDDWSHCEYWQEVKTELEKL